MVVLEGDFGIVWWWWLVMIVRTLQDFSNSSYVVHLFVEFQIFLH